MKKKKIIFLAFKGHSFISSVIKFFTRSLYSHIAILDYEKKDKYKVIEVWGNILTELLRWGYSRLEKHEKGTIIEFWKIEVTEKQYNEAMAFYRCLANKRVPYNYMGVFGFVIPIFGKSCGKYFCSEGAWEGLRIAGIVDPTIRSWKISPDNFVENLKLLNAKKIYTIEIKK